MGIMSKETNRTLKEQFMLRLPDGMRDRIKAAADANKRSMTQEIVASLEQHYQHEEERATGWQWVPPDEQIPDVFKSDIRDQAERRGTSFGEELWSALSGYFVDPYEARDKASRERLLRLVGEIVDIVENDIESRDRVDVKANKA